MKMMKDINLENISKFNDKVLKYIEQAKFRISEVCGKIDDFLGLIEVKI